MFGFECPHCGKTMVVDNTTRTNRWLSFSDIDWSRPAWEPKEEAVRILYYKCPACRKPTILIDGGTYALKDCRVAVFPQSSAKVYPEYVPAQIRQDYEEACSIVLLSPKASATLARRCLQGMIRDFWSVSGKTLKEEIDRIQDKIPAAQWKVLDSVRRVGNIGAHMEKDIDLIIEIDPGEAEKLIKLIELLVKDWYIARHDQEELYRDINNIDLQKQNQKSKSGS